MDAARAAVFRLRTAAAWLLPAIALGVASALLALRTQPTDLAYFVGAAGRLLSSGWADTFSEPGLQVGPLYLLAIGLAEQLAGALGISTMTVLALALAIGTTALLALVVGRVVDGSLRARPVQLGMVGLAALIGLPYGAFVDGHPAQVVVPLLWVLAALEARRERAAVAGLVVGLSAGIELWGVLGIAVLLLASRRREVAVGLVAAVGVTLCLLGPFAIAGELRMFEYRWPVAAGTLPGLILGADAVFPWSLRLAQATLAVGLGGLAARSLRGSPHAVWAAPLGIALGRLVLDPVLNGWYLLAVETAALVGLAAVLVDGRTEPLWQRFGRQRPAPS